MGFIGPIVDNQGALVVKGPHRGVLAGQGNPLPFVGLGCLAHAPPQNQLVGFPQKDCPPIVADDGP